MERWRNTKFGFVQTRNKCLKGHWLKYVCSECSKIHYYYVACKRKDCHVCQKQRAIVYREKLLQISWKYPAHVVLTLRTASDLAEGLTLLKKSFNSLRRKKFWRENVKFSFGSIEVVRKTNGYHLHIHLLAESIWLDSFKLSREWSKSTHNCGKIVSVKRIQGGLKSAVMEIAKYITKLNEFLNEEELASIYKKKWFVNDRISFSKLDNASKTEQKCLNCDAKLFFVERVTDLFLIRQFENLLDSG